MTNQILFDHVHSASDAPCHLSKEAYSEAQRTWLCAGCCSPRPGLGVIDVHLSVAPGKEPLNFVFGVGIPVASRAFLDSLGVDLVRQDLFVGRVYGPKGQEMTDWVTFRGRHRLIIRGSTNVSHRRCAECGRDLYFAMGKRYLYPAPPSGVNLFESDLWGLVLTEELFLQAGVDKWQGIYIDKLHVLSTPKDSLGELDVA